VVTTVLVQPRYTFVVWSLESLLQLLSSCAIRRRLFTSVDPIQSSSGCPLDLSRQGRSGTYKCGAQTVPYFRLPRTYIPTMGILKSLITFVHGGSPDVNDCPCRHLAKRYSPSLLALPVYRRQCSQSPDDPTTRLLVLEEVARRFLLSHVFRDIIPARIHVLLSIYIGCFCNARR
jgi:hypothetical protein